MRRTGIPGNSAAALGAVYGGASVCAWYPITPSSSLAESFISYCQRLRKEPETGKARYAIIQGEDELASVGIAIGAGGNRARSFTTHCPLPLQNEEFQAAMQQLSSQAA